tara:strand:- start:373 stop:783 length:411 start_codon:yes stop_codon:yes gene_type:complete
MPQVKLSDTRLVDVTHLRAKCGARYWEDATVNGQEDTDGTLIPCANGAYWVPLIDLASGRIQDWPQGTTASIHYKVCDDGLYELLDASGEVVTSIDGYVPDIMSPRKPGYGDYVIMDVGEDGRIENWKVDLSDFER